MRRYCRKNIFSKRETHQRLAFGEQNYGVLQVGYIYGSVSKRTANYTENIYYNQKRNFQFNLVQRQ